MGQEAQYRCSTGTKRLLWLIGTTFAIIIIFQHFELHYTNIISSIPFAQKVFELGNDSLSTDRTEYETVNKILQLDGLNSSSQYGEEAPATVNISSVPKGILSSNKSSETDNNHGQFANEQLVDHPNANHTVDLVEISVNDKRLPEEDSLTFKDGNTMNVDAATTAPIMPPVYSESNSNTVISITPANAATYEVEKNTIPSSYNSGIMEKEQPNDSPALHDNASVVNVSETNETPEMPNSEVISISEMNNLLTRSRSSPNFKKLQSSLAVDEELLQAKRQIENAPILRSNPTLYAPLYRNVSMFKRSYELMENLLKVYVYKEGDRPVFHRPILKGIYASEGWFMKLLEANRQFVTKDPNKAHLFYLPFSSVYLEENVYEQNSHTYDKLIQYLKNYLDLIAAKHPFWNRTDGADHFLVACHDWAPPETKDYMSNCIRALCNADAKGGFNFGKDVSLPETKVARPRTPLRDLGGKPASKRSILAFFAGKMHGYVRPILLQHWANKDPDMRILGQMRKKGNMNYAQHMKSSKYCICAKGYEVNSPRVVEAIFYECVPVIISDNFVPPFFEVLNWESFAVFVLEKDIPNLKNILVSIPEKKYLEMQMMVKKVQKHFLWHAKPMKYDIFHMILHSIWYNRVFQS